MAIISMAQHARPKLRGHRDASRASFRNVLSRPTTTRNPGPFKWRIFGFWVLLFLVYLVIAMLMYGIFGMMGALAASSTGSLMVLGIFNGIVGALVAMLVSGIVVAMYQQLAGENPATLSETFE